MPLELVGLLLSLVALGAPEPAADGAPLPSVDEVTKHLDQLYGAGSAHGTMSMAVVTRHFQRTLTMETWSQGDDHMLVVIRAPAREAGTSTLKTEKGLWSYAPRADRMLRVPSGMLSESWMGSHFTHDDLVRESSFKEDYVTTLRAEQTDSGPELVLTMIPRPDAPVIYTRIVQRLRADDWLPIRAEYYDGDTKIRTLHFRAIRLLGGRRIPTVIELIPHETPQERTTITYEAMVFDGDIDPALFTPRGLRRAARRR